MSELEETWALAKDDRDQSLAKLLSFSLVGSKPCGVSLVPLCAPEICYIGVLHI